MPQSVTVLPGVAGHVTTAYSFWSWTGYRFRVDGERLAAHGFPRSHVTLPGTSGPVEARIKGGLFRAHPILVVDGTEYPTGPSTPRLLQVLALLPLVSFVIMQGAVGALIIFGGVTVNMNVIRGTRSDSTKAALLVGVGVATAAIVIVAATVLHSLLE